MEQRRSAARQGHGIEERFRQRAIQLASVLGDEGIRVRPFRDESLPVFSKLSSEAKEVALEHLSTALEVFQETRAEGFELRDNPRLIWRALRRFGWTPQSDIFDKIGDDHVVQIYSREQTPVFFNLNFFKWISFTLEDLYTGTWFQLIRRDGGVLNRLYEYSVEVLSGVRDRTFEPDVPEHVCEEIESELRLKFWIRVEQVSPVKRSGEVTGFIAVCRCWEYVSG